MPGVILVWKVPRSNVLKQRRFRKVGRFGGANIAVVARRKVRQLEIATELQDLRVPLRTDWKRSKVTAQGSI